MQTPAEWAAKGKVLRITTWDEPVMRNPTRAIEKFDAELEQLVADMFATMDEADGVGLAATQVGVDQAIFVFHCPDKDDVFHYGVVCNPVLTLPEGSDRHLEAAEEGCLSWPGAYHLLARPDFAIVEGRDEKGIPVRYEGTGMLARCLQHETDHLNGTVFGDRLSNRSRRKLNEDREALRHLYPADWPITPKGRKD